MNNFTNVHDATNNPKALRTNNPPQPQFSHCDECKAWGEHRHTCSKATMEDYCKRAERAEKDEKWARGRAAHWLSEVTLAHGKIAMLKNELRILRKKS